MYRFRPHRTHYVLITSFLFFLLIFSKNIEVIAEQSASFQQTGTLYVVSPPHYGNQGLTFIYGPGYPESGWQFFKPDDDFDPVVQIDISVTDSQSQVIDQVISTDIENEIASIDLGTGTLTDGVVFSFNSSVLATEPTPRVGKKMLPPAPPQGGETTFTTWEYYDPGEYTVTIAAYTFDGDTLTETLSLHVKSGLE